jgi:hypothetical protein
MPTDQWPFLEEPAEATNPIRKLYGEGRAEELDADQKEKLGSRIIPPLTDAERLQLEPASEMQHVAGSVLRRGAAQANQYGAELVVIAIEREPKPEAVLEGLPAPGYAFGMASTSDDDETIALALRAIASRLERA